MPIVEVLGLKKDDPPVIAPPAPAQSFSGATAKGMSVHVVCNGACCVCVCVPCACMYWFLPVNQRHDAEPWCSVLVQLLLLLPRLHFGGARTSHARGR